MVQGATSDGDYTMTSIEGAEELDSAYTSQYGGTSWDSVDSFSFSRVNKEIGGAMVKVGGAINPFVDIDHVEVNEGVENEDISLMGNNIITNQFDSQPGGGFADITLGGVATNLESLAQPLLGPPGDLESDIRNSEVAGIKVATWVVLGAITLGLAVLSYSFGQLFDIDLGGS